ncbi:MAG: M15 family metallopeptidase [Erysipelotrichaceae bacterium]|nr:M15 family metallopeptidase [Erysipelotrichaceae bacterium]
MKKLIIISLAIFLLSGCTSSKLQKLGYTQEEAIKIAALTKNNRDFFAEQYDENLAILISNDRFSENSFAKYLMFVDLISPEYIVDYVEDEVITNDTVPLLKELVKLENFDVEKLADYLKLQGEYSNEVLIQIVNNDISISKEQIKELMADPYFILDNLDKYAEYYETKDDVRSLVEYVNTQNYLKYYEDTQMADLETYGYQVLVNKFYLLDENYEPEDLVSVESTYGVGQLREVAYEAYKKMQDAAKEEGLSFYITSPYRSYNTQRRLYNNYLSIDSREMVDIYSARPGSSEHQLGLAVDILKNGYDFGNFHQSKEAAWLKENSYKYGFILRYLDEKVNVTGYKYEPWHFRYIGEIAEDVYNSGLTYDEYFEVFIKQ